MVETWQERCRHGAGRAREVVGKYKIATAVATATNHHFNILRSLPCILYILSRSLTCWCNLHSHRELKKSGEREEFTIQCEKLRLNFGGCVQNVLTHNEEPATLDVRPGHRSRAGQCARLSTIASSACPYHTFSHVAHRVRILP